MGCKTSKTAVQVEHMQQLPAQNLNQNQPPAAQPADQAPASDVADINFNDDLGKTDEDIRDMYDLGEALGSGCFGQVLKASMKEDKTQVRAVKVIERDSEEGEWSNRAMFYGEVRLLQQMSHKNIIRFYDFYEDLHFFYVVMELCSGGEVFAKILELKRFSEKNAAFMGTQMLLAIQYIHSMHITHRDVKAENFMLASPVISSQIKMIDFGMACKFEDGVYLAGLCGSPHYLAPELIGQKYTYHTDVWAFGVLMYLLMYGHYPHDAKHPRDIMVKILTESIRWQIKVKLSELGLDFLQRCLEHNPRKRITATEALRHPWITQGTVDDEEQEEALPTEVIRSAHRKSTASRSQVDPKINELRNQKLRKIDDDWRQGIRHGQRLGVTQQEAYMERPEYVRRQNKLATAPSGATPALKNDPQPTQERSRDAASGAADPPPAQEAASPQAARVRRRIQTATDPRRLAEVYQMSEKEEENVAALYEDRAQKKEAGIMVGVVPGGGGCLPGVLPAGGPA